MGKYILFAHIYKGNTFSYERISWFRIVSSKPCREQLSLPGRGATSLCTLIGPGRGSPSEPKKSSHLTLPTFQRLPHNLTVFCWKWWPNELCDHGRFLFLHCAFLLYTYFARIYLHTLALTSVSPWEPTHRVCMHVQAKYVCMCE